MDKKQDLTYQIALLTIQDTRDKLNDLISQESAKEIDKQIQEIYNKNISSVNPPELYEICIQQVSEIISPYREIQEEFSRIQSKYLNLYSRGDVLKQLYEPISGDPTSSPQAGDPVKCAKDNEHYKGLLLFKGMRCNICGAELVKMEQSSKKK
jgi:hypothetical protein